MIRIVFNTDPLSARLAEGKRVHGNLTPVHQEIGEYLLEATKQRFLVGKARDGTAWRAKSAATLERYKRQGDALEYSGVMQEGAGKGAFGNDARGRPLPWGDIPARVWLGLSRDDETNILVDQ